ncbi:hypothetical protein BDV38DRAFT_276732 [Aspergillus pseudotamarii]|uniref:Zn(2)-C6 fungal-type domain-containing protein n=1 Tax=Aspergillus pseudotamarii TaxID=132259 RepID=A0A5N6TBJ9_ASPPS|nr:uncharacterized protein BDV38DRAFT_276732 [Aspergillus pseudotamarii]KAE8143647.1 hypothetical protein BDV38DRAFT_276732 [Aspergillus pseudotamarii]
MFMTLRCGRDDGDGIQYLETSNRPARHDKSLSTSACVTCRQKKLGCSREKTGCRRCQSQKLKCVYTTSEKMRGKKSQRQSQQTNVEVNDEPFPDMELVPAPVQEDEMDISEHSLSSAGPQRPSAAGALPNFEQLDGVYVSSGQPEQLGFLGANQASATKSSTSSATDHAAIVASGPPRSEGPELELSDGTLPSFEMSSSDEYSSTLSDDFFTELLEPFSVNEEELSSSHGAGNQFSFNDLDPLPAHFSSLDPTMNPHSMIHDGSAQECSINSLNRGSPQGAMDLTATNNCECTGTALRILEMVVVPVKGSDWSSTEQKLYYLKRNITQCIALSGCDSCTQDSGYAMLVLVVYEKIMITLEEVVSWWKRHLDNPVRVANSDSKRGRGFPHELRKSVHLRTGIGAQQPHMSIGPYQIDTMEEHSNVLGTLILLQLRRVVPLVMTMKRCITSAKWEAHLELLKILNYRIRQLQATLQG